MALALVALGIALHAGGLAGPFTDGQAGNCGAMFAIFARNEHALGGLLATRGVPIVNPVPPATLEHAAFYTHHPPGLPWLVMLTGRLPVSIEFAARLVALLATLATTLLLADLACRLAGRRAGLAAGLLALMLPAGLHDGLLVNYETVAIPALLLLLRALLLERGSIVAVVLAAVAAACADWIALLPLAFALRRAPRRRWWAATAAAGTSVAIFVGLGRLAAPGAGGETLAQALGASVLARDFDAGLWLAAQGRHLVALYGLALLPALLGLVLLARGRTPAPRRAVLLWLTGIGLANITLFARHATGHEHYALLLLPAVVLSTATLLFPRDEVAMPPALVGALAALVLLAGSFVQARPAAEARTRTGQAALADRFAEVSGLDTVYLRPGGAPFVFLHRAARHVVPQPVASAAEAHALASAYRARFGLGPGIDEIALADGEALPTWLADSGPPRVAGGFRFYAAPPTAGGG
jgi:hypothetical protein